MTLEQKTYNWYIFYKNRSNCKFLIKILQEEKIPYYIATSVVEEYEGEELIKKEYESIKNLIFIQSADSINIFLNKINSEFGLEIVPYIDCMTGGVACVSDIEMQRFIKLSKNDSDSIEILKDSFEKFKDKPHVRIKAGPYEGLDGRLVRIRRDRKVVISLGSNAISISGIHFSLLEFINP